MRFAWIAERGTSMHYLHTLPHLIDQLADGDGLYWCIAIGVAVVVVGCIVYDIRGGGRKEQR